MVVYLFNKKSGARRKPVVAVDGTAASGKGTLAKALAKELGFAYLDTGALYRTIALATLTRGGDPSKIEDIRPALALINARLPLESLTNPALRSPAVADAAPKVAAIPEVRAVVRAYQEEFMKNPPGRARGTVLDGRDIGTVVCPDAEIKFYVTASAEERARRRYVELKKSHPELTEEAVLQELSERDRLDSTRHVSPLRPAADADMLDTTGLTPDQTLAKALAIVRAKIPVAEKEQKRQGPGRKGASPRP